MRHQEGQAFGPSSTAVFWVVCFYFFFGGGRIHILRV